MKMAKLEMKLVLASMLLGYNYDLVNESGKHPDTLLQPDRNNTTMVNSYHLPTLI